MSNRFNVHELSEDFLIEAKQLKRNALISWFITTILAILVVSVVSMVVVSQETSENSNFGKMMFILFVGSLTIFFLNKSRKRSKKYSLYIKEHIVKHLFKETFGDVEYTPEYGFSEEYISSTKMYPKGNIFNSNDLLVGTYLGVGFSQADVMIKQTSGKTNITHFKGRWLIYDFPKKFNGTLQLRSNYGRIMTKNQKVFSSPFSAKKLNKLSFEDQTFNHMFNTYTDNPHDAYYIMTPHMMDHLKQLSDTLNCEFVVSFIGDQLHIAIFNFKDAFEIRGRHINEQFIKHVYQDMSLIKSVIEELKITQ